LTTPSPLPFTDSFTGNNGTQLSRNWLDRIGDYSIANNKILGASAANLATVNGLSLAASDVSADINVGNGQFAGVLARYQSNGGFDTGTIASNGDGTYSAYIFRFDAATNMFNTLATVAINSATGNVTGASGVGASPIVITSAGHGLVTGQQVTITGVN